MNSNPKIKSKYKYMDEVLKNINTAKVKLHDDIIDNHNEILHKTLESIVSEMKKKDELFKLLYTNEFFGGSYYDGLKVACPDEYDIDLKFQLHKLLEPSFKETPDFPGFVSVEIDFTEINRQPNLSNYQKIKKFLRGNELDTGLLMKWFIGLVQRSINDLYLPNILEAKPNTKTSGPAVTLFFKDLKTGVEINIDLVPCFSFPNYLWPKGFKQHNSEEEFFIIPKSPSDVPGDSKLWRLSFQIQERMMMNEQDKLKPTIKLLKLLRDSYTSLIIIKSYFIKTIFLQKLEEDPNYFENRPCLGGCFMHMLKLLYQTINEGEFVRDVYGNHYSIPYFWKENFFLLKMKEETFENVTRCLRNRIKELEANDDPEKLWDFFGGKPSEKKDGEEKLSSAAVCNYFGGESSAQEDGEEKLSSAAAWIFGGLTLLSVGIGAAAIIKEIIDNGKIKTENEDKKRDTRYK